MDLLSVKALRGPNVWGQASVLEARIRVAPWRHFGAKDILAFQQRLAACLPGCSLARAASDGETAHERPGTFLAEALRDVALALQTLVGTPVSAGGTGSLSASGTLDVAVEYEEERLGRACFDSAQRICLAALEARDLDVVAELLRLRALAEDVCQGRATGPLVAAARARGIPFRRLDGESLVQLGHGGQQRRIRTSVTDRTGKIAEWISLDKELSKQLLAELGLPVPLGRPVSSAEQAWATACELGLPVAVKPRNADYGHGIGLNLSTREQVVAAYAAAREYRDEVLVERFASGSQFRITVVGNQMIAAVRREPVRLVGDGQHTILQLIELANLDPRRGDDLRLPLEHVCADDDTPQMLAEQGVTLDTVVPAGVQVVMSRIAHSWAGAGVTDVTDLVHPCVAAQAVRAARLIGLDVAGLDVIAEDISRPLEDQGGVILEVNAEPTIAFHFPPLCDRYRPVCEAIIESLFPAGQTGRIPLAVITGGGDRARIGRWLAELLRESGRGIGRASGEGLYFQRERLKPGDQANLPGSRAALLCPEVDVAVLERELTSIRHEGLGLDRVDVAILSCLGRSDPSLDVELERAARVLVAATAPTGAVVIEADDPTAAAIAQSFVGTVVVVSDPERPLPGAGRAPAHAAVCLRDSHLVVATRDGTEQVVALDPWVASELATSGHRCGLLAAVGAAWAMGIPVDAIAMRIESALREGAI
jgi:cyanophycin synthetase